MNTFCSIDTLGVVLHFSLLWSKWILHKQSQQKRAFKKYSPVFTDEEKKQELFISPKVLLIRMQ